MEFKVGNYLIANDSNSIEVHYIKDVKAKSLNTYFVFANYSLEKLSPVELASLTPKDSVLVLDLT